jgi:NAD(P)-dependent dehydrogenase (short-subunit alcohol dehydrogenase family)
MSQPARFDGKTVVVTGATMGIGAAVVKRLHSEGARLVLVARRRPADRSIDELVARETAVFVQGSVTDVETAEQAVAEADRLGGVDVLVNNAGVDYTSDLLRTPDEDIRRVFETNFFGATWMLLSAARAMERRGGGSIVNVTSRLASIGVPTMAVYAASKAALLGLTRAAAVELADRGIRVNAVAPGLTQTPLVDAWIDSQDDPAAQRAAAARGIPQGRLGTPDDVASAVAWLAADESAHVTGATVAVDGGYTAA